MKPIGWVRQEVADALDRGITCSAIISPVEMVGMVQLFSSAPEKTEARQRTDKEEQKP